MSVEEVSASLDVANEKLPTHILQGAHQLLEEATQALHAVASETNDQELAEVFGRWQQATGEIARAFQLCGGVQDKIMAYRSSLVGNGGSSLPPDQASPRSSPTTEKPSRLWKTVSEERGGEESFHSYGAAKRALGSRPGQELHHIVEQCQGNKREKEGRSGFTEERINTTDNFAWLPIEVHRDVSKTYSRIDPATGTPLRDTLSGLSWERQYRRGIRETNNAWKKWGNDGQ